MMKLASFSIFRRSFSALMTIIFVMSSAGLPYAQTSANLPEPGQMMALSPAIAPAMLRGFTIDPRDPFSFEFLMDRGQTILTSDAKKVEYQKQIKYFLASLAIPEKDLWVNLSPYENDRIIADNFGLTAMGRDLLAQDYILKQITASLIHPDSELGREFWGKVYKAAAEKYGTTNIPVDTFNKVWIMPDQAEVYAHGFSVLLVKSHLKVMLDSDRTAEKAMEQVSSSDIGKQILREVILPILEKEVNEGANFAAVRQITSALILATWYKKHWQQRLLNTVYSDSSKVRGVDQDPANNAVIYQKYVEAFKQGVFNLIKEEVDALSQEPVARKYFSGGYRTSEEEGQGLSERITERSTLPEGIDFSQSDSVDAWLNFFHSARSKAASEVNMDAKLKKAYGFVIEQDAFNKGRTPSEVARAPLRINSFFADHFKKHLGILVLKGGYPALYDLLKDKPMDGEDVFDVIAQALKEKLAPWYSVLDKGRSLPDEEDAQLEALTFQSARLIQNVLMGSSLYSTRMSSGLDLLQGRGWNSSSLSMMTVLLADIMGLRGVSMVEVNKDEQWIRYPLFSVHHFVNMVRAGGKHFILDQGREVVPFSVMVVDVDGLLSPAEPYDLDAGFKSKLFGLDARRLMRHIQALKDLKVIEKEVDDTLTEQLFKTSPGHYAVMNNKLNYDFNVKMEKKDIAVYWMGSIYEQITGALYKKLNPDYWINKTKPAQVREEHQEFLTNLNEFFGMAVAASKVASEKQDADMCRLAAHRYRIAAQMASVRFDLWDAFEKDAEFLKDFGYFEWDRKLKDLGKIISDAEAHANVLDQNVRIYAARDEIERDLIKARNIKRMDPRRAADLLIGLNERIDLFLAFFEAAYKEDRYRSVTPFKDVIGSFYKAKEMVDQEQEGIWNVMLDYYNATGKKLWDGDNAEKFKGTVDNGEALGCIDLDTSKFDIKTQGSLDALFTEVHAADAVKIEGLEPVILSITPGEGFLKRLIR